MLHYNDEFYHSGILGQRKGVRNGPPYPLKPSDHSALQKKLGWWKSTGKTKEPNEDDTEGTNTKTKNISDDYKIARRTDLENMTNDELRRLVQRLRLEKQYDEITKAEIEEGKSAIDKFIDIAKPIATATGTVLTIYKDSKELLGLLDQKKNDKQKKG